MGIAFFTFLILFCCKWCASSRNDEEENSNTINNVNNNNTNNNMININNPLMIRTNPPPLPGDGIQLLNLALCYYVACHL